MLRYALLIGCLLCTGSCVKSSGVRDASFEQAVDGTYSYEDYRLRIEFFPQPKSFSWRFTNHTSQTLKISHDESFLSLSGTTKQFTLWGGTRESRRDMPPIVVKPGGFVAVQYPVLYSSPFMPWRVRKAEPMCLFLSANWDNTRHRTYRLCFQTTEEPL